MSAETPTTDSDANAGSGLERMFEKNMAADEETEVGGDVQEESKADASEDSETEETTETEEESEEKQAESEADEAETEPAYELDVPEGLELDTAWLGEFSSVAREHGIEEKGFQALAEVGGKFLLDKAKEVNAANAARIEANRALITADEEIGGVNEDKNRGEAKTYLRRVLSGVATGEVTDLIQRLEAEDNPLLLRAFVRAAKQSPVDDTKPGERVHRPQKRQTLEERFSYMDKGGD